MRNIRRKVLSIILGLSLTLQPCMVMPAASAETKPVTEQKDTAKALSGEVIVRYRADALKQTKDKKQKLKDVRRQAHVSSDFGESEYAVESANSVAATVSAQKDVLSDLKDYLIEDTVDFRDLIEGSDAPVYSRISSDIYTTDELIKLLSSNPDIESVTPNYTLETQSLPDYELNDTYASSLLHLNTAAAVNKNGPQAYNRGYESEAIPSLNASVAWDRSDKLTSPSRKPVVAVIDSGIDTNHEDLRDSLWTNPGNIGLRGDHGYNFIDDSDVLIDDNGHGTHCAGIIAAQKNNGIGTAGVAAGLVELMGLRILGPSGSSEGGAGMAFNILSAFQYVLKAKKNGVNITVCSNSWGASPNSYQAFDEIFDALGEAGILVLFASNNQSIDIDSGSSAPANNYSDYKITVGSINEDGAPSGFSNYGNANVDFFAPGNNVLSTVSYNCYSPFLYSPEKLKKTTSYYGEFSTNMTSGDSAPVLGDDGSADYSGVSQFGKPVVVSSDGVTPSLTIAPSHAVNTSKNAACLDFTLRGLKPGSECYIYFPYSKSRYDDGKNFDLSLGFTAHVTDPDYSGEVKTSDIIRKKDGSLILYNDDRIQANTINTACDGIERHKIVKTAPYSAVNRDDVASYGIGMRIQTSATTTGEITFYLNHVAVSNESVTGYYGKYDVFSGTSMACPAAAGVAALIACLEPAGSKAAGGAKGGKYVKYLKNRLYGMTKHSEALEGKCTTEGYLDFTCLDSKQPVISDVRVNTQKGTIKLIGKNLKSSGASGISYKRIFNEDSSYKDISDKATWASDGTSVTIKKASGLIGTYTRFKVTNNDGTGVGAFFLVRGEKTFKMVGKNPDSFDVFLVTDAKKKRAICIDDEGNLSEMKAKKGFVKIKIKKSNKFYKRLYSAILKYFSSPESMVENKDAIKYGIYDIVTVGNMVQAFVMVNGRAETQMFLGSLDLSKKSLKWSFKPVYGLEIFHTIFVIGKTIYAVPSNLSAEKPEYMDKSIYYLKGNKWKKTGAKIPENIIYTSIGTYKNAAYFMGNTVLSEDEQGVNWKESSSIYRFNGKSFKKMKTKYPKAVKHVVLSKGKKILTTAFAETKKGIIGCGSSLDGYGNTILYDPVKDKMKSIPVTLEPGIATEQTGKTAIATKSAFYFARRYYHEFYSVGYEIYRYSI